MVRHTKNKTRLVRSVEIALYALVIATFSNLVFPFWQALSAGTASLSIAIFGSSLLLFVVLRRMRLITYKRIWYVAVGVSIVGIVIPQLAFYMAAHRHNANLSFDPVSYLTFSGATYLTPSETRAYKTVAGKSLDIARYSSRHTGKRPTVILLHGGAWRYGSHLETGRWPEILTKHGYTVISVEYRLSSDTYHTWRDAPADVRDAVSYIKTNADTLSVDEANITLLGQSAGGHLALLEAYRYNSVAAVVALYAPVDPTVDYRTSKDKAAELDFIGGPPSQYPDRYRTLSALTHVSRDSPRTLLIQGKSDDLVSPENVILLSRRLAEHHIEHRTILLPLTGHSFENQQGGFATQIAEQNVTRFLAP